MNMKKWVEKMLADEKKTPMPILSFPSVSLLGITVSQLISDPDLQAKGMKVVADRNFSAASVSMMDLSVEAEAFGSQIRVSDEEVPTVIGAIAATAQEAEELKVPTVGTGRTGLYIDAIAKAVAMINDRPVFAGTIGPFSLAGRLIDVNEAMIKCYEEPELVHTVLEKAVRFLLEYIKAYKEIGAHGVVIAEPLAGLLSPGLADEFSVPYVKEIVEAVQDDDFIVIYHNCGNGTIQQIASILSIGAAAYHFGNSISMREMLKHIPSDVLVMGNVDPASRSATVHRVGSRRSSCAILNECRNIKIFVISSGCDIPPASPWENIDAFFAAVREFYEKQACA